MFYWTGRIIVSQLTGWFGMSDDWIILGVEINGLNCSGSFS